MKLCMVDWVLLIKLVGLQQAEKGQEGMYILNGVEQNIYFLLLILILLYHVISDIIIHQKLITFISCRAHLYYIDAPLLCVVLYLFSYYKNRMQCSTLPDIL